ncbi:MAG: sigma-E factor negative regulatory protein [Chromatiales bacterium]
MIDEQLQKVSAFIDGECTQMEARGVIDRVLAEETARGVWTRYHFIGDAMRGELPRYRRSDFTARVQDAITREPAVLAPAVGHRKWLKPAAGLAIAASVAMVAVLGVQRLGDSPQSPAALPAQVAAVTPPVLTVVAQPMQAPAQPAISTSVVDWPQLEELYPTTTAAAASPSWSRLNSYLVNYSEQRAMLAGPGMLPYVKVVGYEQSQ